MTELETSLRQESRDRYLTYALSVVTGRALPDVRDGLKPVQRRILYAMANNLKLNPSSNHRKSAAVVGEVLARFHPHGDVACYDAMVRMAQDFSLRYPLVDGQGNFGSLDGDSPAAYRYTEARLLPLALEALGEIDQETVGFRQNFDATTVEPEVLPSRIPQLLMNGASGIAVGMATSIPPHNLKELIKGLISLLEDPDLSTEKLTNIIKGPDFPTGCSILNTKQEITEIYRTGRGSIRMRGDWKVEDQLRGKQAIIITSLPYTVNKAQLVEKIGALIGERKVPQLVDVRDESTDEIRVVLELASGAEAELAMAYLYKNTNLESLFSVNFTALVPTTEGEASRPELLSLKGCLQHFLDFREEIVFRRLQFEKKNLLDRIHLLEGFVTIFDALDEAIAIIRKSQGRSDAAGALQKRFKLTERQSFAIVDMRIYQLSRTNITEIRTELKEKQQRLKEINAILKQRNRILELVKADLEKIAQDYGDKRRSLIVKDHVEVEFSESDFVVKEEVFAIVTTGGWLKRIRQGNDVTGTRLREGDSILDAHPLTTVDQVAIISTHGYLYVLPVTEFPASSGYGSPIQKILKFRDGEGIAASFAFPLEESGQTELLTQESVLKEGKEYLLVSQQGMGYVTTLDELSQTKRNGKRIMKLRDGDALCAFVPVEAYLALFTRSGTGLMISTKDLPRRNQAAIGVALMGVREGDRIVGAVSLKKRESIVVTPASGKEKSMLFSELPLGKRALKGRKVVQRSEILSVRKK